jgi:hypothetical protein
MRLAPILIAILAAGISQGASDPRNNDGGSDLDKAGLSANNKELFEYGMTMG